MAGGARRKSPQQTLQLLQSLQLLTGLYCWVPGINKAEDHNGQPCRGASGGTPVLCNFAEDIWGTVASSSCLSRSSGPTPTLAYGACRSHTQEMLQLLAQVSRLAEVASLQQEVLLHSVRRMGRQLLSPPAVAKLIATSWPRFPDFCQALHWIAADQL